MFRYELHCHDNVASRCGVWSPEEMVQYYKTLDYTGIVVTDHFFNGNCAISQELAWRERVEAFCVGYERAKEEGDRCGLDVFFAFEYSVNTFYGENLSPLGRHKISHLARKNSAVGCDFLIYGLDKDWLLAQDDSILRLSVNDFLQTVKEQGGTVIQAHPFRLATSYMNHIALFPLYTDGIEVLNGNPNTLGAPNQAAQAYADAYGFFATAGTDAHYAGISTRAVTELTCRVHSVCELLTELKKGRAKLYLEG